MIAGTYLAQQLVSGMGKGLFQSLAYTGLGMFVCIGIYLLISRSLKPSMRPMYVGGLSSLLWGLLIGLFVSACSGIGFGLMNGYSFQFENIVQELHLKALGSLFPALSEEIVFRGGIVEGIRQLFGSYAGLAAGSVPFGILHLVGIFFGSTVTAAQILGISLAGLMLSLVYLRFGILGSVGCHLVWNSLVSGWIKVYGITDKTAVSALEGSWATCIVLAMTCVMLSLSLRNKPSSKLE
jgi:membrane protease YdiL (CAAX protease family)